MEGEGDWTCIREFLGLNIDTESGTVALLDPKLQELQDLPAILTTNQRMGRK